MWDIIPFWQIRMVICRAAQNCGRKGAYDADTCSFVKSLKVLSHLAPSSMSRSSDSGESLSSTDSGDSLSSAPRPSSSSEEILVEEAAAWSKMTTTRASSSSSSMLSSSSSSTSMSSMSSSVTAVPPLEPRRCRLARLPLLLKHERGLISVLSHFFRNCEHF